MLSSPTDAKPAANNNRRLRVSPMAAAGILMMLAGTAGYLLTRGVGPTEPQTATQAQVAQGAPSPAVTAEAPLPPVQGPQVAPAAPIEDLPAANLPNDLIGMNNPRPPAAAPAAEAPAGTAFDRLVAQAKAGSPQAALLLGLKYLDGDGVAASDGEGVRWLRRAAEQGQALAQYRLGTLYERGRAVPQDPKQAAFWYEQAAKSGNRKAMHNLAVAYADGAGVQKNFGEAVRWFKAAADLGLTDSQFNLAVLYERGMGVTASLTDAYKWYLIAANQGDNEAKTRVEALATQLQPAQRDTAEKSASSFKPRPANIRANEPPSLAQLAE